MNPAQNASPAPTGSTTHGERHGRPDVRPSAGVGALDREGPVGAQLDDRDRRPEGERRAGQLGRGSVVGAAA